MYVTTTQFKRRKIKDDIQHFQIEVMDRPCGHNPWRLWILKPSNGCKDIFFILHDALVWAILVLKSVRTGALK